MSKHDEEKKDREYEVLTSALAVARAKGGEARRNVDRISGAIEALERPDFLIYAANGKLIGIEHFRVDHFVKGGRKAESAAAELNRISENGRRKIVDGGVLGDSTGKVEQFFGERLSRAIQLSKNACIADVARSLEAGLYSGSGHVGKLPIYRSRVAEKADGRASELGFLIEMHSDLRGLFVNDRRGVRKIACGELPMIAAVYDLLKRASGSVDWIILAFCGGITDVVEDAAVVRCGNGAFGMSLKRQGLERIEYLGLGKDVSRTRQKRQGEVSFEIDGDAIHYEIENTSEGVDIEALWRNSRVDCARALTLAKAGAPFIATLSIQMMYEMLRDRASRKSGAISVTDIDHFMARMSCEEKMARAEAFEQRWDIKRLAAAVAPPV